MMVMKVNKSTTTNTSIITNLKDQGVINDNLLACVSSLTLEQIIAVKLELSCNYINNRFYGFDIWRSTNSIVKEALLTFAISTTKSRKDAARFLGLTYLDFKKYCKKYGVNI